jgi:hypothetical protein
LPENLKYILNIILWEVALEQEIFHSKRNIIFFLGEYCLRM